MLALQVAIRLLLECALDQLGTQFILLSPQDVTSIQHASQHVQEVARNKKGCIVPEKFAKIIEMRAARQGSRGQQS